MLEGEAMPEKLEVWMISPSPATPEVTPVRSESLKALSEELSELMPVSLEVVTWDEDIVVIVRHCGVPWISGHVHHLASLQQAGRQKLEGEVSLDDPAASHLVRVNNRIVKHRAELLVVRPETQRLEELRVDETVRLQEGTSDHLRNFGLLNVNIIDQGPDQLNGPGGSSLGVAHYEDVIVTQLKIGNPIARALSSPYQGVAF